MCYQKSEKIWSKVWLKKRTKGVIKNMNGMCY